MLCFVLILVGCSEKIENEEKLLKIKNVEAVSTEVFRISGTVVLDNGKDILELSYNSGNIKFEAGKKYDVYYQGDQVKGARQLK